MRRLAVAICVVGALLGGCAGEDEAGTVAPRATTSPVSGAATGATEPRTPQQLRAISQLHFNSFAVGDFGTFWDDFDADAKRFISREEYIRRLEACMRNDPNKNKPFRVTKVTDNRNGTWTVDVRYLNFQIKFPARYEGGRWRFSPSPEAKRALRLPMDRYLATQCRRS